MYLFKVFTAISIILFASSSLELHIFMIRSYRATLDCYFWINEYGLNSKLFHIFYSISKFVSSKLKCVSNFAHPSTVNSFALFNTLLNNTSFSFEVISSDSYPSLLLFDIPNFDTSAARTLKCSEVKEPFAKFLKSYLI